MPDKPQRGAALLEAHATINGERQDQYGNPEDSFGLIAEYWSTYLAKRLAENGVAGILPGPLIRREDVGLLMTLFKVAREQHGHKRDNLVDGAAYLAIVADMKDDRAKPKQTS